jgi:hypothetical protein
MDLQYNNSPNKHSAMLAAERVVQRATVKKGGDFVNELWAQLDVSYN